MRNLTPQPSGFSARACDVWTPIPECLTPLKQPGGFSHVQFLSLVWLR